MSALKEYLQKSKAYLARQAAGAEGKLRAQGVELKHVIEVADRFTGAVVTGPASAALTGYIETRHPAKDGTRASAGPLPLGVLVGGLALVGAAASPYGKNQFAAVAAANFGLAAGTYGRAAGAAAFAKARAKKAADKPPSKLPGKPAAAISGIGYQPPTRARPAQRVRVIEDDWTPAERELLGA